MYDHNQLTVPDSFLALYLVAGRLKPNATRAAITDRYEFCEDLAGQLFELAETQHADLGIPACDVLRRCHAGLQSECSGLNEKEAEWVVKRLAELAGWESP